MASSRLLGQQIAMPHDWPMLFRLRQASEVLADCLEYADDGSECGALLAQRCDELIENILVLILPN